MNTVQITITKEVTYTIDGLTNNEAWDVTNHSDILLAYKEDCINGNFGEGVVKEVNITSEITEDSDANL
tara:strand:+ start:62 stop:268 length:207 start_codon:yes stop_codon:yes gene_type:complete